ncbi:2OG-Fe(II) oxygenase [Roseomonas sp. BN140053]|uniref:2OG-Fe(II) oxygenase n=1 Tax=Roseomonas sp. BN140053 TaxID=3391898 RepID=UPI0039ECBC61
MPPSPPALLPGDFISSLSLLDGAGQPFDLLHQSLAHLHRVLVFSPLPELPESLAQEATARGATLVLVEHRAPDGSPPGGAPLRVFDPDRQLAGMLGLAAGGASVLTARGRVGLVAAGPGAAEAVIRSLPAPEPAVICRSTAPVLLLPEVLEPELQKALLRHWQKGAKIRDRVASGAGGATGAAGADGIKRRADVPLDDRALYETFARRLQRRALPEMFRAFRFRAASFEPPRIGCYDAADRGAFGAHRDNRTPFTQQRRFALSLNLNTSGEDYEGGTLRFPEYGPELYAPGPGDAAIFCCDMLHEAMPVTRGRRFAVFTFFTDAEGARQEQELIRQRVAAGDKGLGMR